jgi:hypothetical protein
MNLLIDKTTSLKKELGIEEHNDHLSLNLLESMYYLMYDIITENVLYSEKNAGELLKKSSKEINPLSPSFSKKMEELIDLEDEIMTIYTEMTREQDFNFGDIKISSLEIIAEEQKYFNWQTSNIQDFMAADILEFLVDLKNQLILRIKNQHSLADQFDTIFNPYREIVNSIENSELKEELQELYSFSFSYYTSVTNVEGRWSVLTEGLKEHERITLKKFKNNLEATLNP